MKRILGERLIIACMAMIFISALLGLLDGGIFTSWAIDQFWQAKGPIVPPGDEGAAINQIVIVKIDSPTLRKFRGEKLPIDRKFYAGLVDRLASMGAKLVGFDVTFDEPGTPQEDAALLDSVRAFGRVVSNCFLANNESSTKIWVTGRAYFSRASFMEGLADMDFDRDMFVRRMVLFRSKGDLECRVSLALALYLAKLGFTPNDVFRQGSSLVIPGRVKPIKVFLNHMGRALIPFFGGSDSGYPRPIASFSALDIMEGRIASSEIYQKTILVGGTAKEFKDSFFTPFSRRGDMPGVEIHANILRALLDNEFPREISGPYWWLFINFMAALFASLFRYSSVGKGFAALIILILLSLFFCFWLFSNSLVFVNPLDLAGSLIIAWLSATVIRAVFLQSEKAKISSLFKQYVSPTLLTELLANPDAIALGGSRRQAVVLFADIRGFTSFCEEMKPEQIITFLNSYFSEVTQVIFHNGGILNKYIGDGLMAFFGVPTFHGNEPESAVAAAIEMKAALAKLKETYSKAQIYFPIDQIGIGINGGDVVAGNVGSKFHLEYTLLGDTVNLAARFESLASRGEILISKWVQERLPPDRFLLVSRGNVKVKGRKSETEAFEVRGFMVKARANEMK